jgi:Bax protein
LSANAKRGQLLPTEHPFSGKLTMKLWFTFVIRSLISLLVVAALVYPFLQEDPVAEAHELAPWQMPSKLSALDKIDQRKLLARLTYPHRMPTLEPVPDFAAIQDTAKRKEAFFDYLQPFIDRENSRLHKIRQQLLELQRLQAQGQSFSLEEYAFVYSLFDKFKVDYPEADATGLKELLLRVDEIPDGLVLNQAAKESGWGSSRFAIEGYNFFGQWCFKAGCGFVPSNRTSGKYHEVAKFQDIAASVNAYFYNLNTFYVYDDLRTIRAEVRKLEKAVSAQKLAHGLKRYSERGEQYVVEIQTMIVNNSKFMDQS